MKVTKDPISALQLKAQQHKSYMQVYLNKPLVINIQTFSIIALLNWVWPPITQKYLEPDQRWT